MGCVLRGRSKALGVEGHLRQVGIQGYGRRPMDTLWDTMWSTLWGTLWRPRNPRGYPQNPWILERDSRETQDSLKRLKRDSRETVSTTPKAWIPKSEKSEMRTDTTHSSSKSSSNKRKSDTKGEGGK